MTIEQINLTLYILQIVIISFGIYIGYRNYIELMRKNNIEEAPYLGISQKGDYKILVKNYGKTALLINKIEGRLNTCIKEIDIQTLKRENKHELMPNEEKEINIKSLATEDTRVFLIDIYYENHVKSVKKTIKTNFNNKYVTII